MALPDQNRRKRTRIMEPTPLDRARLEKWPDPVYVQPKLNGERAWAYVGSNGVELYSSTGSPIEGVPHIKEELKKLPYATYDGELYRHGMAHQDIRGIVSRGRGNIHPQHEEIEYWIFDLMREDLSYEQRIDMQVIIFSHAKFFARYIKPVYPHQCCREAIDMKLKHYIQKGYEGIVVRNPLAIYTPGKAPDAIQKYKPKKQDAYRIVGTIEETSIEGLRKGTLGAFILSDKRGNIFKAGSGLTAAQRKQYWEERDRIRGKYVVIEYPETTKKGIPSQPIFKRLVEEEPCE